MASILTSLRNTVIAGFVLAFVLELLYLQSGGVFDQNFYAFLFRWLHVLSGIMWIGLLYYFNFVQIPNMPNIPDEQKPAISGVIAPAALWWFRWGAMSTIVTGLILAHLNGYLADALTLGFVNDFEVQKNIAIGIGMWLGSIMWFNVWFVIWPNQKKHSALLRRTRTSKRHRRAPPCCSRAPIPCCLFQCCFQWLRRRTFTEAM